VFEDEVAAARRTERVSMRFIACCEPLAVFRMRSGVTGGCRMRSSASAVVDVHAVLRAGATERSRDFAARLSQRFLWMADLAFRGSIPDISSNCCSKHYPSNVGAGRAFSRHRSSPRQWVVQASVLCSGTQGQRQPEKVPCLEERRDERLSGS
jgi:hypothetical protein